MTESESLIHCSVWIETKEERQKERNWEERNERAIDIRCLNLIETHVLSRLFHIFIRIHLLKSPPLFFHFGSNQTTLFISREIFFERFNELQQLKWVSFEGHLWAKPWKFRHFKSITINIFEWCHSPPKGCLNIAYLKDTWHLSIFLWEMLASKFGPQMINIRWQH